MYPAKDARELAILLRISHDLDVVGDVTATVGNPSELLAWTLVLDRPVITAWRAGDSGRRYLQASAQRNRAPVRGHITAVLPCDRHDEFWGAVGVAHLAPGERKELDATVLSAAWEVMPISPTTESTARSVDPAPESLEHTEPA